jgi:CBS domain-containing protein
MSSGSAATSFSQREATPLTPGQHMDTAVRDFMTPGVVSITEDASIRHAYGAMVVHRVHAVLVVGRSQAKPLGWVTSRGLLSWLERERGLAYARDAITERPVTIEPGATAREAVSALSQPGVSHLLVTHAADLSPEGVVTTLDLMALATR